MTNIPEPYLGMVVYDSAYSEQRWRLNAIQPGWIGAIRVQPADRVVISWSRAEWNRAWENDYLCLPTTSTKEHPMQEKFPIGTLVVGPFVIGGHGWPQSGDYSAQYGPGLAIVTGYSTRSVLVKILHGDRVESGYNPEDLVPVRHPLDRPRPVEDPFHPIKV